MKFKRNEEVEEVEEVEKQSHKKFFIEFIECFFLISLIFLNPLLYCISQSSSSFSQ